MADSIQQQLRELEASGRISVHDQRQVHPGFGFASIAPSPLRSGSAPSEHAEQPAPETRPAPETGVAASLDDAWSRLKRTIDPS